MVEGAVMAGGARARALNGWLAAIAESGWRRATAEEAAAAAGLGVRELLAALGDRHGAVAALQEKLTDAVAEGASAGGDVRECLFDGLMQGFDLLAQHRAAVLAIWKARDPGVAAMVLARAPLAVRRIALVAGMQVRGLRGRARMLVLGALAWRVFTTWRADESADMSATMAMLDRLLEKAGRAETEGLSPDLLGLPGVTALFGRLRPPAAPAGPVPRPSPGRPPE